MSLAPFQPSDNDAVLNLRARAFAQMNLARFLWQPGQQVESLEKDCLKLVWKAEKVEGYAAAYPVAGDSFRLNLLVGPQHTRRGIGTRLLKEIEAEAKGQGGRQLEARLLEGMEGSLEFAVSRGFVELHRMRCMSLRAGDFRCERWSGLGEKLSAEGFTVTTLEREAAAGDDPLSKLIELQKSAVEDWPETNLTGEHTASDERLRAYFSCLGLPDRVTLVKREGQYVGYTSAERKNMLGTAVHPGYRGRGIATYMKACDLKRLIDAGAEYFESSSANPAMWRVNEKLGYRRTRLAEIRLAKYL